VELGRKTHLSSFEYLSVNGKSASKLEALGWRLDNFTGTSKHRGDM
jgi:hypothetical protein